MSEFKANALPGGEYAELPRLRVGWLLGKGRNRSSCYEKGRLAGGKIRFNV